MAEYLDRASLNPLKQKIGIFSLFRYARCADKWTMVFAAVCSFLHGAAIPVMVMFFAKAVRFLVLTDVLRNVIQNELRDFMMDNENTWQNIFKDTSLFNDDGCYGIAKYYKDKPVAYTCENVLPFVGRIMWLILRNDCIPIGVIAVGVMFISFGHMSLWMRTAEKQVMRMRRALIHSIMLHDVKWFNKFEPSTLKEILYIDIYRIKEGILDKVSGVIQWLGTSIVGVGIAFFYDYKLAAVVSAVGVLKVCSMVVISLVTKKARKIEINAYQPAEDVARMAVAGIRTVIAYDGQEVEIKEYNKNLKKTNLYTMRKSVTKAFTMGFVAILNDLYFVIGFFGAAIIINVDSNFNIETMLIVLLCIRIAIFSDNGGKVFGLNSLDEARTSAYTVYSIIDEVETCELSPPGDAPKEFKGQVEFKRVTLTKEPKKGSWQRFSSDKELDNVSFAIPAGQSVALVGTLSSGVRFIPELLLRFEEPTSGKILFDGKPLNSYCLHWLRFNIGYVTSDPVMFSTSIANNVRYHKVDATDDEIIDVLQRANVWTMIADIPGALNFVLGRKNAHINLTLSQRQRICLATALISDPKILILDKVTAKMEGQTCFLTEEAIVEAMKGRTTFIIPNNRDQLQMADVMLVLRDGQVVEEGEMDKVNFEAIVSMWQDVHRRNTVCEAFLPNLPTRRKSSAPGRKSTVSARKSIAAATTALGRKSTLMRGIARDTKPFLKRRQYRQSVYSALRGNVQEEVKAENDLSYSRLFRLNSAECAFILLGCVTSVINGLVFMAIAYYFSQIVNVFTLKEEEREKKIADLYMKFIYICVVNFVASVIKHFCFTLSGDRLTQKIRKKTFGALMKQDLKWFDGHDSAKVITSLREDSKTAQELTGLRIGNNLFSFVIVVTTLAISLQRGPLLTLILFANLPILFFFGYIEVKWLARIRQEYAQSHYKASKVALESFKNIRTVTYLSAQEAVVTLYMEQLEDAHIFAVKKSLKVALVYAICQLTIYSAFVSSLAWVAFLLESARTNCADVFVVYSFILFAVIGLGSTKKIDYEQSRTATQNIYSVMDSAPDIDCTSFSGRKIRGHYKDELKFEDVSFSYPANPEQLVLDHCTFSVQHGTRICLAGQEGNGNYAVLDLLLRMYDPAKGTITLANDKNLKKLNVKWLRSQVGIICHTASFFDRSIAENIAYGDNSRQVSREEMEWAAKAAQVYPAIMKLRHGFEAKCNDLTEDTDKFKLDLARLLVKNPKIVMIESVPVDMVADRELTALAVNLLRVTAGKTVVSIPSQTSTLLTADQILVFEDGKVVATGPPAYLAKGDSELYKMMIRNCPWFVEQMDNRENNSARSNTSLQSGAISKKQSL